MANGEIQELLLDVIDNYCNYGAYLVAALVIIFNILFLLKKTNLYQTLLVNASGFGLSCIFIANKARLTEWGTYYIPDAEVYQNFRSSLLDWSVMGLTVFVSIVCIIVLLLDKYKKKA